MFATAESKNQAVSKLESLIERGRSRAANVIDHVMRHQPTDRLVRGDALQFRAADNLPEIPITLPDREQEKVDQTLHRNAIHQMAQTTDMPVKFIDSLQSPAEPWGRELLAHNLQTVFNCRFQKKRYLLRSLQQEVRGFLSDSYRRIDSRPVVEAYNSADTVNMPAGNSIWRLSNAICWVAGKTEDAERKLEISKVAGQILNPA